MKTILLFMTLMICSMISSVSFAQEKILDPTADTSIYIKITMNNGMEYSGKILADDGREILFQSSTVGKIYLNKADIRLISELKETGVVLDKDYKIIGPFTTRHHFTTNAFPVQKGENYMVYNLYGPEAHFAVIKGLSIGVMATWILSPVALSIKYTLPANLENLHFAIGTINGSSGYLNVGRGYVGLHYGTITLGQRGKNISLSGGYGYIDLGFNRPFPLKQAGIISLAGIISIGKKASFIFDSMIAFGNHYREEYETFYDEYGYGYTMATGNYIKGSKITTLLMPGFRFQTSERRAFQFSLAGVIEWRELGYKNGGFFLGNTSTSGKIVAFPIPMVSWYLRL